MPVPDALSKVDLSGAAPWIIGGCAALGEELLFRAALQPLVGLWIGAVIFAAAHVGTASVGTPSNAKRVAYLANVAVAGVALGWLYEHVCLLSALLVHATIDIAGLLTYREVLAGSRLPDAFPAHPDH